MALAMKDALRSGDLYLPQSKQHVSFWEFTLSTPQWQEVPPANATIVNRHHALPLSALHGIGTLSSSDAQRFGIWASRLCHLLGFYFMPRIRDLKDQQLYRVDRLSDYGVFTPLLTKAADLIEALSAGVSR